MNKSKVSGCKQRTFQRKFPGLKKPNKQQNKQKIHSALITRTTLLGDHDQKNHFMELTCLEKMIY